MVLEARLSDWECAICKRKGTMCRIGTNQGENEALKDTVFKFETTYGEVEPNFFCDKCGWKATLVKTYSY